MNYRRSPGIRRAKTGVKEMEKKNDEVSCSTISEPIKELRHKVDEAREAARGISKTVDRSGYLRPRKGADRVLDILAEAAVGKGLKGEVTVEEMLRLQRDGTELQRIADTAAVVARGVGDAAYVSHSKAWSTGMAYYAALSGMTRLDPELNATLKPVVEFLAQGPRRSEEEPETDTEASAQPTPPLAVVG